MYNNTFEKFPVLETERLIFRKINITDVDDIYEYAVDLDAFIYTDGFPNEHDSIKQMIATWNNEAYNSKTFIRWGIELKAEKKIIGGIYLFSPYGKPNKA